MLLVPKIFHQFWLDPVRPVPPKFMEYRQTWIDRHPDWKHNLWTASSRLPSPLVCQRAFDFVKPTIIKAELLRYEFIYRFGGVYIDLDFECFRNIEPVIDGMQAFAAWQHDGMLCNAFMGGATGTASFKRLLDKVANNVLRAGHRRNMGDYLGISGPVFLTEAVAGDPGFTCVEKKYMYPYLWTEEFLGAGAYPDAYAAHHWAGTWNKPDNNSGEKHG